MEGNTQAGGNRELVDYFLSIHGNIDSILRGGIRGNQRETVNRLSAKGAQLLPNYLGLAGEEGHHERFEYLLSLVDNIPWELYLLQATHAHCYDQVVYLVSKYLAVSLSDSYRVAIENKYQDLINLFQFMGVRIINDNYSTTSSNEHDISSGSALASTFDHDSDTSTSS